MRGGLPRALLVLAVGAVLALLSGVRPWLTGVEELPDPLPLREVELTGADVAPGVTAIGLLGLAGVVAVLAARGLLRVAVGVLLALGGVAVLLLAGDVLRDPSAEVDAELALREGPFLALAAGLLLLAGGGLVALRSRSWAALGRRYEPPAARADAPATDRDLWESLDRGEDPTGRGADPRG